MRVSIFSNDGTCLWEFEDQGNGRSAGFTSPAFLPDVISALQIALTQAEGQLGSCLDEADIVLNIGMTGAKIDSHVPIAGTGNNDPHRKHLVMPSVISKSSSAPIVVKIDIIRKKDVALVRAVNDDDISSL